MNEFNRFLLDNYYSPFGYDEYVARLEEFFGNNQDLAHQFGMDIGADIADAIVDEAGLPEEEYWRLQTLEDHLPIAYEASLGVAHMNYLISFFARHVANEIELEKQQNKGDDLV